jgi:hypothetical protein
LIDLLNDLQHVIAENGVRQDFVNVCKKYWFNYDEVVGWPPRGTSVHKGRFSFLRRAGLTVDTFCRPVSTWDISDPEIYLQVKAAYSVPQH